MQSGQARKDIATQWRKVVDARMAITSARAEFVKKTLDGNPRAHRSCPGLDRVDRAKPTNFEITDDRFENDILAMDAAAIHGWLVRRPGR